MKFTLVVCLPDEPADLYTELSNRLDPYSAYLEVEPYRDYLCGEPSDYRIAIGPDQYATALTWADIVADRNARSPDDPCHLDEEAGGAYYFSTYNPDSKWDYWGIGIVSKGHFLHREGHESRVLRGDPDDWEPPRVIPPQRCDGGPVASLDLEGMREAAAANAHGRFDRWLEVVRGTPEARSWREFFGDLVDGAGDGERPSQIGFGLAEKAYYAQPRLRALKDTEFDNLGMGCMIEAFQRPREAFIERARANAVLGYAMLTADRRWLEYSNPGRVGFHPPDLAADLRYIEEANMEMDTLPDSGWLVAVTLHT